MKFFIECMKSKEKGTLYHVLKCDVGYTVVNVSMEKDVMATIADCKLSDIYNLKEGDKIPVKLA